jgi:AbrB family looped-hinge helix DNA binding protein
MSALRLRPKNQITLPKAVCDELGIKEGDYFTVQVTKKAKRVPPGAVILTPSEVVERPWTEAEWREKEREADEDIKAGRLHGPFDTADEAIAFLRASAKKRRFRA